MSFLFYNFWSRRRYDDEMENTWGCGSWFEYLVTVILSTVLLIAALVLTLFWVINYQGGFAWSENPKIQFNLHPVLMVAGFITLSGFCKYKVFYNIRRNTILLRYCGCTRHRGGIIWNDIFRCWEVFWFCILLGRQAPLVFPTSSASRNKNKLQIHIGILYHLNTIFLFVCLFVEFFFSSSHAQPFCCIVCAVAWSTSMPSWRTPFSMHWPFRASSSVSWPSSIRIIWPNHHSQISTRCTPGWAWSPWDSSCCNLFSDFSRKYFTWQIWSACKSE